MHDEVLRERCDAACRCRISRLEQDLEPDQEALAVEYLPLTGALVDEEVLVERSHELLGRGERHHLSRVLDPHLTYERGERWRGQATHGAHEVRRLDQAFEQGAGSGPWHELQAHAL